MRVEYIDLEPAGIGNTCRDSMKIYDGLTESARLIATRCDSYNLKPTTFQSTGNSMLVTFTSNSNRANYGFWATYSTIPNQNFAAPRPTGDYTFNLGKKSGVYFVKVPS